MLNTHVFSWWTSDNSKLSDLARETIADERNEPVFSVVSAWEIVTKAGLGKLKIPDPPEKFVIDQVSLNDLEVLPMHLGHALRVHDLPDHHRDPFDRLLVAQALAEDLVVLTADPLISQYPTKTLW